MQQSPVRSASGRVLPAAWGWAATEWMPIERRYTNVWVRLTDEPACCVLRVAYFVLRMPPDGSCTADGPPGAINVCGDASSTMGRLKIAPIELRTERRRNGLVQVSPVMRA